MLNFRTLYRHAEEHMRAAMAGLFVLLALLILAQSIFSPLTVISVLIGAVFLVLTITRPLGTLAFVAMYLPFEPFVLKFMPDDIYLFARYFSEGLIYVLAAVVLWRLLKGSLRMRKSPIDLPFMLFLAVLAASSLINLVPMDVALLGSRQILRFLIVFFLVLYLRPQKVFIKRLTFVLIGVAGFQAALGIAQAIVGAPLDAFLLPSEARTFGDITVFSGVAQFWEPGSRVFGTLGRYDRLGNFLYFFLLIGSGLLYHLKARAVSNMRRWLWLFILLGLPALALTFSRASWFAFALGFLFIGAWAMRDRRVAVGAVGLFLVAVSYLGLSGLQVRHITELPGQTLTERFYETFSYTRWRGEYAGLGRVFWFVHTPLSVVRAAPLFGFGPGQYGGGVVHALHNTAVYEKLGLPFGVFGTEGYIDISWFSLWGEAGTIGLALYVWMYSALFGIALRLHRASTDAFVRGLAVGVAAGMIGIALHAFLVTLLEIRTAAFYLWLYSGFLVVLYTNARKRA